MFEILKRLNKIKIGKVIIKIIPPQITIKL